MSVQTSGRLGPAGFAHTNAGLLIPAQSLDRAHRVMPRERFRQYQRWLRVASEDGLRAMFTCTTCNEGVRLLNTDQIVTENEKRQPAGGGRFKLECGCTTWTVR